MALATLHSLRTSVALVVLLYCAHWICEGVFLSDLRNDEFAIMQYDSRDPRDYWLASALWNKAYCDKHGHKFIFYSTNSGCTYGAQKEELATPWCKVKAMIAANDEHPDIKFFIYMDSDAVIDRHFEHMSLKEMATSMQQKLNWNPDEKPIIFNQDGPCWWCRLIRKVGYTMCLNAGTVAWYRHKVSEQILREWWDASMDPYETNPIKRRFRIKWPWEQDRQMAVYNRSFNSIQIASQPERSEMQTRAGHVASVGWCLSHLPGSGCYISHHCANANSKQVMRRMYSTTLPSNEEKPNSKPVGSLDVSYLSFP